MFRSSTMLRRFALSGLTVALLTLASLRVCSAQVIRVEPKIDPAATAGQPVVRPPRTVRMTVDPAPEPSPALKYRLTPREISLKAGNSIPHYYRAEQMVQRLTSDSAFEGKADAWRESLLADMPKEEVQQYLDLVPSALIELEEAVQCEDADWGFHLDRTEGERTITFPLAEFQEARALARILVLKARLEIANGEYEKAIATSQMAFRLGRDAGKSESFIAYLVGVAIHAVAREPLLDLIAAPNSPNLYWAATTLEDYSLPRRSIESELTMAKRLHRGILDNPAAQSRSEQEWMELLINAQVQYSGTPAENNRLTSMMLVSRGYPVAKQHLLEAGYDAAMLGAMPVGQLIAVYESQVFDDITQSLEKWTHLSYLESQDRLAETERRLTQPFPSAATDSGTPQEVVPIIGPILGSFHQVRHAQARHEHRFAALRVIEAIRMHAAANDRKLPDSLEAITLVPVPIDPMTGKPFPYRVEGGTAFLDSIPPGHPEAGAIYEITIRDRAAQN